jgi:hypothetical protein
MRPGRVALAALMGTTSCRGNLGGPTPSDAGSAAALDGPAESAAFAPTQLPGKETSASWRGDYKSERGTLYIPADWKSVHWNVAESSRGLGDGTIRLTVDPAGRIQGVVEGPLGPAVIAGFAADGGLTATVRPEHSEDGGFAGTLIGKVVDGRVEGSMHVSPALADTVRIATFVLGAETAPGR